jgi:type III pantothenate kinase
LNLLVDIGNTRIKAALFANGVLENVNFFENNSALISFIQAKASKIKHAILCSVVKEDQVLYNSMAALVPTLLFTAKTAVPISNLYQSTASLGSDRLAAAVGAWDSTNDSPVLNIDTGTCIKYNFINSAGVYLGGAISPGLQMRLLALNKFTARLPLVEFNSEFNNLIGQNTNDSILSGTIMATVFEVDGTIYEYRKNYPNLCIIVSGGDTDFFVKRLKNSIFARPHLVLEGLNKILEYNVVT